MDQKGQNAVEIDFDDTGDWAMEQSEQRQSILDAVKESNDAQSGPDMCGTCHCWLTQEEWKSGHRYICEICYDYCYKQQH